MQLKINNINVASPSEFSVTVLDLDNGESTVRTADGTLNRDRIAVKRQLDITWPPLKWSDTSTLLQAMSGVFFEVYYPDPMTGQYVTKTFYAGNRPAPVAIVKDSEIYWGGLKVTLIER
jgi:hypothetical protein